MNTGSTSWGGLKQAETWWNTWKMHTQKCFKIQMWITSVWSYHLSGTSLTLDHWVVPLTPSQVVHSTSRLLGRAENKKGCFESLIRSQMWHVLNWSIISMHGPALKYYCIDYFLELRECWGRRQAGGFVHGRCGMRSMRAYYTEWACCVTNTTRLRCGFAQRCNAWLGDYRKVLLCSSVRNNY